LGFGAASKQPRNIDTFLPTIFNFDALCDFLKLLSNSKEKKTHSISNQKLDKAAIVFLSFYWLLNLVGHKKRDFVFLLVRLFDKGFSNNSMGLSALLFIRKY
jgi:hypothetical protein